MRTFCFVSFVAVLAIGTPFSRTHAVAEDLRIGAWNIEWLGKPGNRSGDGKNVAQKKEHLAGYIAASGVAILALEEISVNTGTSANTTLDAAFAELNSAGNSWKYELFPKKNASEADQHVGLAWNEKFVQKQGGIYDLNPDDFHFDFNLLERGVHAAKFSIAGGKTDFVLVPLHLKSNRGGAPRTSQQRGIEAERIVAELDELRAHFDDLDIVMLGDFNVLSSSEQAVQNLVGGGFRDLNAADGPTTFSGSAPFDRVYVANSEPEFTASSLTVHKPLTRTPAEHKKELSDHYMVYCDMTVGSDDDTAPIGSPSRSRAARMLATAAADTSTTEPVAAFESFARRYLDFDPDEGFELSQDYPTRYEMNEQFPWEEIDFRTHPKAYMTAALKYCFEGNEAVDFVVQKNQINRKWYHAPWLHEDGEPNGAGREYLHGMTRERRSRPFELHPQQKDYAQNWAVGFYNERGGYTLGNVWRTCDGRPNLHACTFPDHTVSFKLLFTDAPEDQVPYLKVSDPSGKGALVWDAHIYKDTQYKLPREIRKVRLLQVDVAVKDPRAAGTTGWVFGTFVFDGSRGRKTLIDNLVCVGLSWHDDERVFTRVSAEPTENPQLHGSIINTELLEPRSNEAARMHHLGLGGRMNGPVDNQISSCISCHGRAALAVPERGLSLHDEAQVRGRLMPFFNATATKPTDFSRSDFTRFFHNIRGGSHLEVDQGTTYVTTDYSQQVAVGIRNYYQNWILKNNIRSARTQTVEDLLPRGSRGEE